MTVSPTIVHFFSICENAEKAQMKSLSVVVLENADFLMHISHFGPGPDREPLYWASQIWTSVFQKG